jgi:uncharacterized protein involved in exopolysaccharide biosynthesis/Mrp family chromosome partitioning ATPase
MTQRPESELGNTGSAAEWAALRGEETLADLFRSWGAFILRRKREIILGTVIGTGLGVLMTTQLEPRYQSELFLRVEPPARSPIETEVSSALAMEAFVEGQVYIIESTAVLSDVVRRLNLTEQPYFQPEVEGWLQARISALTARLSPPPAETPEDRAFLNELSPAEAHAVRTLRANIAVSREAETEIISVTATADGARLAAEIANAIGVAFVANREASQFTQASRVAGWLDDRALELQRQLAAAEDAVAAFRIANNLVSGEPGTTLSEQQLTELNTELIATRAALAERRAAFARVRDVVSAGGATQSLPEMQGSDVFGTLRARLLELERRELELGGPAATNPRLTALREERAVIETQLTAEVQRVLALIANEIETLESREGLIVEALAQAGGETGAASRSSVELRELERRAAAYSALYERYLNNAGLVDESISYLISGVEVIDPAAVPLAPRFPTPKAVILFMLVLGATMGAVVGMVREAALPGFMTSRQVIRTVGRPVLASIPELPRGQSADAMARDAPMSPFAEALRTLRHELTPRQTRGGAPVLLLTSAVPHEGKTSLAAAMATSAIGAGLNVLLIDADIRRGGLTRIYQADDSRGLTDILRARSWGFQPPVAGAGELDLMPTGTPVSSPSDLFVGDAMRRYLAEARANYDLILIDGPPVANMADAPLLAQLADSVGFIVRWKDTPRSVVTEALSRLGPETAKVGIALNAVDLEQVAQYGETYGRYVLSTQQYARGQGMAT